MSHIRIKNDTEPSTPSTGRTEIYVDSASKLLKTKDDTGTVTSYGSTNGPYEKLDLVTGLAHPTYNKGTIFWDETEDCPAFYPTSSNVTINIGQEIVVRCVNKTASPITNGTPIYISGAQGNRPKMDLARADNYTKAVKCIGLVTETSVAPNAYGYVTIFGLVHDLDTSAFLEGDEIWLNSTGGLTKTKPSVDTGNCIIKIGDCVVSDNADGVIFVHPIIYFTKFGNVGGGNYSVFEDDGTLRFVGNATVYKDLIIPSSSVAGGAAAPSSRLYNGSSTIYSPNCFAGSVNNDVVGENEMQHDYKEGTDIETHIHIVNESALLAGQTIQFVLDIDMVGMNSSSHYIAQFIGTYTSPVGGTPAWTHIYLTLGIIAGANRKIGDAIAFCLTRNASTDTSTSIVHLKSIGFHYECDTVGSRFQQSK